MPVINRFAEMHSEITAWRRDIHENPELLFDTHRTSALVAEKLREFGCDEVATGIGRTGVVGVIKGRETGSGKVIGLRADMDALPIPEATGKPYASKTPGKMHACGHDGHTAMLLGAAKYLAETRRFDGTVAVIFQPAEEGGGGGREMVEDGMMERFGIQQVYGLHNMPNTDIGHFCIRPGAIMAATDVFEVEIEGKGGHAARPHDCVDTTLVAAQIIVALQSIVARNVDPIGNAVLSVTTVSTDSDAFNVIAHRAKLTGTVRTLIPENRDLIEANMTRVVEHTARAMGATARLDYTRNYPVTVNDAAATDFAIAVAREVGGEAAVDPETDPLMGGEDFSFMLNARPGAFIFMGNGPGAGVHHPEYDFNDEAIPFGCSYWATIVEKGMPLG